MLACQLFPYLCVGGFYHGDVADALSKVQGGLTENLYELGACYSSSDMSSSVFVPRASEHFTTQPDRAKSAIAFGRTMSWLNMS